jgi:glucokinase
VPERGSGEAIGLDVGGTKINAFRVTREGTIVERSSSPTPADDEAATLSTMVELARSLTTPSDRDRCGAAGLVDAKEGVLRFAPNLAWRDLPIAERMRDALGLPCQVDNDASMAAYGEYRFGAGRGYRHLLLVTVGTGIGGGIVSDGRLFRGANGFAAEIGTSSSSPTARSAAAATAAAGSRSPPGGRSIGWAGRRLASTSTRSCVVSPAATPAR